MSGYFGPGVEVAPIAPAGTEARGWQYWPFQNQNFIPRPDSDFTAQRLRSLSNYFVARLCIQNCINVISQKSRQIRPKKKQGESNKDRDKRGRGDATLKMLNDFFDRPDRDHDWQRWVSEWLNHTYTGDWASVLIRRKNGKPYEARVIDGAFITCLIDPWGYRPEPPLPAFQQLWSGTPSTVGGIPFVNLTTDELVYWPRNIVPGNTVSSYLYGVSETQQAAEEIAIGQERMNSWLFFYTTGQIPDMIHIVPPNIQPDQTANAQKLLNAEMSGQIQKRSGNIRLLQGFVDRSAPGAAQGDQIIQPKEKMFTDPFDDMHLRKMAMNYGTSAQRLMKQMNRASAQASQEASEEEGTMPVANSVKGMCNWIIATSFGFGFDAYEMVYDAEIELDVLKRAQADASDVGAGIISRDEARKTRGLDEIGGDAAKLMITTATGTTPVDLAGQAAHAKDMAAAKPQPEGDFRSQKLNKRRKARIDPSAHTPDTRQAQARMESALVKVFGKQREKAVAEAQRVLNVRKADDSKQKADAIYNAIEAEFAALPAELRAALEQAALSGIQDGILQVEFDDPSVISSTQSIATRYAEKRAAEMVGMKYGADGELVPNPSAHWAISDTTRDRLREIVKNAFEEKTPFSELIEDIRNADIFSEERAAMIARTEVSTAQVKANFGFWKDSGAVTKTKWLALGPDPCPVCLRNAGEVRKIGERFPSGEEMPLAHPNCSCILQAYEFSD